VSKAQPPSPADAIAFLGEIFKSNPIKIDSRYLAEDLAHVRRAFPQDTDFALAIFSIAKRLTALCQQRQRSSPALQFELDGWHRESFPSHPRSGGKADLRLVFRIANDKVELLAFGHRRIPQSVYLTARERHSLKQGIAVTT
jgi:hypothetical protein